MLTDKDNGYRRLLTEAFGKNFRVQVGIFEAEGNVPKKTRKGISPLTVQEVASFHEFGLGVPERSFLRAWFDENVSKVKESFRRLALSVVQKKRNADDALELLGQTFVGQIQKRISDNIPPPLAVSTVKAKGSDVALIDTGQLRSSITYRVDK